LKMTLAFTMSERTVMLLLGISSSISGDSFLGSNKVFVPFSKPTTRREREREIGEIREREREQRIELCTSV
jgi:hypothetical protein